MSRGQLSPIDSVVREAEERAQREWDREHRPCPHETLIKTFQWDYGLCPECGAKIAEER